MKKNLLLVLSLTFFGACIAETAPQQSQTKVSGPSRTQEQTFIEQYKELEKEPVPTREELALQESEDVLTYPGDRQAEVYLEAQAERRGEAPIIESNYIFKVKQDKSVYSYDKHNQVWTDQRSNSEYKETKRLWSKPKRYDAATYYEENGNLDESVYED